VLNASNEVAVEFFLQQKIRFDQIHEVNLSALSALQPDQPDHLDDLLKIDEHARAVAVEFANKLSKI
jgi:1-deoxy-D-xylulose-5-phosphate reductoisomerase